VPSLARSVTSQPAFFSKSVYISVSNCASVSSLPPTVTLAPLQGLLVLPPVFEPQPASASSASSGTIKSALVRGDGRMGSSSVLHEFAHGAKIKTQKSNVSPQIRDWYIARLTFRIAALYLSPTSTGIGGATSDALPGARS